MKRIIPSLVLLSVPVVALAFDMQHGDDGYTDTTRFSAAERAGISLLTDVGAVAGNPDGSFAPHRTLNRAEFTKIALLSHGIDVSDGDASQCFPDIPQDAWFSRYVCRAKKDGIVQGNPDGLFHPDRPVNNAEATKILTTLFDYDLPTPPENERWAWYRAYMLAAEERGVALPSSIEPDHALTRGQMARLAAAFVAENDGELDAYRAAERGQFEAASSSSSSSSSSSVPSSSSSSSSVSSSSSAKVSLLPAKNSFFLSGERTPMILGGTTVSADEASYLRIVQLTLRREVNGISKVYFVDHYGTIIAELKRATSNNDDHRKWEVFVTGASYQFPANEPVKVGIAFDMLPKDGGGSSNELVEIESFSMQAEGVTSGNTKYLFLDSQVYPIHQTAFGRLTMAKSVLPTEGVVTPGTLRKIGSVQFAAETSTGGTVAIKAVDFILTYSNVSLSNWKIGDAVAGFLADCGIESAEDVHVVCAQIPDARSNVGHDGLILSLYADVALPAPIDGHVNIMLAGRGRIGQPGSFTWTDHSGIFTWIEEGVPFGGNVSWTVTK